MSFRSSTLTHLKKLELFPFYASIGLWSEDKSKSFQDEGNAEDSLICIIIQKF
jgi:hypothetical protein